LDTKERRTPSGAHSGSASPGPIWRPAPPAKIQLEQAELISRAPEIFCSLPGEVLERLNRRKRRAGRSRSQRRLPLGVGCRRRIGRHPEGHGKGGSRQAIEGCVLFGKASFDEVALEIGQLGFEQSAITAYIITVRAQF
jgi:hypothetical protein